MKLSIHQLSKVYQDGKKALGDLDLELDNGVFGLLGPNGAGKSTLLEILSLNLMPTTGQVLWKGRDIHKNPQAFRQRLGYLPQTYGLYPELTARQFMKYMGGLFGLHGRPLRSKIDECLERTHLSPVAGRKIKSFSGGMRQRLAIAHTLINSPEFLIIDEPTTGLDPSERVAFRNMLFDLGHTCVVLLSTHIVKDVEFTCHRMMLLYDGLQRFLGEPGDFMGRVEGRVFTIDKPLADFKAFAADHTVVAIRQYGDRVEIRYITPDHEAQAPGSKPVAINLEDAYIDFIREQKAIETPEDGQGQPGEDAINMIEDEEEVTLAQND